MAGPTVDLSPVAVLVTLASTIFSAQVAEVVGPYIVIALGAMCGAAVALLQAEKRGRFQAFVFFFGSTVLAVLLTVPFALLVATYITKVHEHWLFAPIAFGLGYVGDKWNKIFPWIGGKVNKVIDLVIELRSKP
jgi:small basic protein